MYEKYKTTRFSPVPKRNLVWKQVAKHLQHYIPPNSTILDLGSGYCNFINNIKAKQKYALDKYLNPQEYASPDITPINGDHLQLNKQIKDESLDVIFASNFIEHLYDKDLESYISLILKKLKPRGILILMQPNFKFSFKNYFDDYTHVKAWTHTSLTDYLKTKGFQIALVKPKFLPFSMKSSLPISKTLISLYLKSPFKPFAGQMLIIARKPLRIN
jgi:2-polyprenyl-3-methyl-5-hydroxy-6-metoxy-1,4-benzoquinol methylase